MTIAAHQGFALSPQQRRMWMLDPHGARLQARCVLRIDGPIEPARLDQAIARVVQRHEALRTTFGTMAGLTTPVQMIDERLAPLIEYAPATSPDVPFPLSTGPNVRIRIDRHRGTRVLVSLPALCADLDSLGVFAADFAAALDGQAPPAPPQYADVAAWLDELSAQTVAAGEPSRRDIPDPLIPSALAPGSGDDFHVESLEAGVDQPLFARLQQLAHRFSASSTAIAGVAWALLILRLTSSSTIRIATRFAGRRAPELAGLIGPIERYIPLEVDLESSTRVTDLVGGWHEQVERIAELEEHHVAADPGASTTSLEYAFSAERRSTVWPVGSSVLTLDNAVATTDTFLVKLRWIESESAVRLRLDYDTSRLAREGAERLLSRYSRLLKALVANPEADAGGLDLLDQDEKTSIVHASAGPSVPRPAVCLHELIERQALATPEAVAVICGRTTETYHELTTRAKELAALLRSRGVGPDVAVGVCLERSLALPAALLGVLNAGGAYVPLDPVNPTVRLAYMIQQASVALAITTANLAGKLPPHLPTLVLDDSHGEEPVPAVPSDASPGDLAYVLYTSGSTGTPKGVMVPHSAVCNRILWAQDEYPLVPGDRVLQAAAFGFDFAVWEIFAPLAAGAALVLPPPDAHRDIDRLLDFMIAARVTVAHFVPSLLDVLACQPRLSDCRDLRLLFSGGETLGRDLHDRIGERLPHVAFYNQYGPTEGTIDATFWRSAALDSSSCSVPIGQPIANCQAYVVDARLNLVPAGTPGELCLGGDAVARGYVGDPMTTAVKFVPDPFGESAGARLYRTGDRARRRADGVIEFLGRIDDQVKVGGTRIEPGEIEARLREHPLVREAAVVVRADNASSERLVGYLTGDAAVPATDLKSFVADALPEYMVPSAFVWLPQLPRGATGKLDRAALPAPEAHKAHTARSPRTDTERRLLAIWTDILHVDAIGIDDGFFELGGQSLLAMRLMSRVRHAFHRDIPLRALFASPTIAGLAERIAEAEPLPDLPVAGEDVRVFPLSFAQERLWFLDRLAPGSATYNIPGALRLRGDLDIKALEHSLQTIVARHAVLRTRFLETDGEPFQSIEPATDFRVVVRDLASTPADEREGIIREMATEEAQTPFDLAVGPLVRATVLVAGPADCVLLLTLHHIVADAWSLGLLVDELTACYRAYTSGTEPSLPALPAQYGDFARWQRTTLQGTRLEEAQRYWRTALDGASARMRLPSKHRDSSAGPQAGARHTVSVPIAVKQRLEEMSRAHGVTLYTVLLAAFGALLHRWTGERDVVITTSLAERERPETQNLIGLFINILPLRLRIDDTQPFASWLPAVADVVRGAQAHQHLPFEKLVQDMRLAGDRVTVPFSQVGFVLYPSARSRLTLGDLEVERLDSPGASLAKTDLTLYLAEIADGLTASFEFAIDGFDRATIEQLGSAWAVTLATIAATPDTPLHALPQVSRASRTSPLESNLSERQLLFWAGQQRYPNLPVYNVSFAFTIRGPLEVERWRRSYAALIRSSDAMRTVVETVDGVPVQSWPERDAELEVIDLCGDANAREEASRLLQQRAASPLDCGRSMVDSVLIRLSPSEHVWLINHHQLIADAWSTALMLGRIGNFYASDVSPSDTLPNQFPQYAEYLEADRSAPARSRRAEALEYWRTHANAAPHLQIYSRQPACALRRARRYALEVDVSTLARIQNLLDSEAMSCGTRGLTTFSIVGAAFLRYLREASGSHRIALGIPFHNRPTAREKTIMGPLMETLPIAIDVIDEPVAATAKRVADAVTDAMRHTPCGVASPLEAPLYHFALNYINARFSLPDGIAARIDWLPPGWQQEVLMLHLVARDSGSALVFYVDVDGELLDVKQQRLAVAHFARTLDATLEAADGDRPPASPAHMAFDF